MYDGCWPDLQFRIYGATKSWKTPRSCETAITCRRFFFKYSPSILHRQHLSKHLFFRNSSSEHFCKLAQLVGLKKMAPLFKTNKKQLNQSCMPCSRAFSRAWRRLLLFPSNTDWFFSLFLLCCYWPEYLLCFWF